MRILILTQYYPPENGAPQNRLNDLAKKLTQFGHAVTVLTAMPSYPVGRIFERYRGSIILEEDFDGVCVVRTWAYASPRKTFFRRLLNYFTFVVSCLLLGSWKIARQDVLLVESPPLFAGISGYLLSKLKGAKLVFNVSDLWPQSAVSMGELRNRTLITLSTWLEEFIYKRSHLITGQTQGIVDDIRCRFPEKDVRLITNGVDLEEFSISKKIERWPRVREEFGLTGKFVVGYAGLHGLAQGLDVLIDAARILETNPTLVFALFGDGPEKDRLIELATRSRLANIRFLPSQPRERMPEILQAFDIAVIPLRRIDLFKGALPSKMFEAMAAAIPLVVSIDGEARRLVDRAQAGICVEPENASAIADAIMRIYEDSSLSAKLGSNGREHVKQYYDRMKIAKRFDSLLQEL